MGLKASSSMDILCSTLGQKALAVADLHLLCLCEFHRSNARMHDLDKGALSYKPINFTVFDNSAVVRQLDKLNMKVA